MVDETSVERRVLFRMDHASKSFGSNKVLKDISLNVSQGQVVAVIGPSGGGKSTLLRCATMLETLDGGTLEFDGTVVSNDIDGIAWYADRKTQAIARKKFSLVFQDFNLFSHWTVLHNIMDPQITVLKRSKQQAESHARELIKKMGLAGREDMVPCELSGGQKQRVAIARALAMDPEILFFDEPTSALDPELTQEVLKVVRQLASEHMTMVIVTHEMGFARDVADRIVFMDGGFIVEEGPAAEVIDNPQHERTKAFLSKMSD